MLCICCTLLIAIIIRSQHVYYYSLLYLFSNFRAANVYVKEEMPAATSLGRIAARMLSSVLSIDQNGLMGYKAAVTRKTLSRGANASGQLHSATEGGHASRQVDLDPEVAGMGVFFQL